MIHLVLSNHENMEINLKLNKEAQISEIFQKVHLDPSKQFLTKIWERKYLQLEKTLVDCNIRNGEKLLIDDRVTWVFINGLTGRSSVISNLTPETTTKDFFEMVARTEEIDVREIRLLCNGIQLPDSGTLADFGIANASTLFLTLRLKGGSLSSFPFADVNCVATVNFDPNAPAWRTAHPGFNLKGTCNSSGCTAFQQSVVIPRGFGTIDLSQAVRNAECPMCHTRAINVNNSVLYGCNYAVEGEKKSSTNGNTQVQYEKEAPRVSEGRYDTFNDWDSPNVEWHYIRITVTQIERNLCSII